MGLFFSKNLKDAEEERYEDIYETFYGKRLDHKLTEDEKLELDVIEIEMLDELDEEGF